MPSTKTKRTAARPASKKQRAGREPAARKASTGKRSRATTAPKKELRKGPETEVTQEVLDFIRALDNYKKAKNRPFPTWSEVLEVLKQLGYRRVDVEV